MQEEPGKELSCGRRELDGKFSLSDHLHKVKIPQEKEEEAMCTRMA